MEPLATGTRLDGRTRSLAVTGADAGLYSHAATSASTTLPSAKTTAKTAGGSAFDRVRKKTPARRNRVILSSCVSRAPTDKSGHEIAAISASLSLVTDWGTIWLACSKTSRVPPSGRRFDIRTTRPTLRAPPDFYDQENCRENRIGDHCSKRMPEYRSALSCHRPPGPNLSETALVAAAGPSTPGAACTVCQYSALRRPSYPGQVRCGTALSSASGESLVFK